MTEPDWMTPDPWEIEEDAQRREQRNAYRREYEKRPEVRERKRAYFARPEVKARYNAYHREYKRQWRARQRQNVIGYLHSVACRDPNHRTKPSCRPIPVFRGEQP